MENMKVGILTVSDRCFKGETEDTSCPNLKRILSQTQSLNVQSEDVNSACVPDEIEEIKRVLLHWCDELSLNLVLTTGGTGFSPRDVTPEATQLVIEKETPGLVIAMITKSLAVTSMAMLSRPVCGIRKNTLVVNLPGSKKAAQECLEFILPALSHALDLVANNVKKVTAVHSHMTSGHTHSCLHGDSNTKSAKRSRDDFIPVSQRARHSPYPMVPVEEALKIVLQCTPTKTPNYVTSIQDGFGCVLAEDIVASQPFPPFPASVKDGYAVIAADSPGERQVLSAVAAGETPLIVVQSGCVSRITTGAPLPDGADAVVQVEDTELVESTQDGKEEAVVRILTSVSQGHDVRSVGCDIPKGEVVLKEGERLGPNELGLLATVGVTKFKVFPLPKVALLSTGNEVVDPGEVLGPGQIYDSNRTTLLAALRRESLTTIDLGVAKDSRESLVSVVTRALKESDVLITTGGVSMGEKDLLKPVLEQDFSAKIHFGRVFMKPGKPTTFATIEREGKTKLVFSLPGNPVSATVTFYLFVVPALRKMSGWPHPHLTTIPVKLSSSVTLDPRPEYHRVNLKWCHGDTVPTATSTGGQCSSRMLSMRSANALLVLPPKSEEQSVLPAGAIVQAMLIATL